MPTSGPSLSETTEPRLAPCLLLATALLCVSAPRAQAQAVTTAGGAPAELTVRGVGEKALRVTLRPLGDEDETAAPLPAPGEAPHFSLRSIEGIVNYRIGELYVTVTGDPLSVQVSTRNGRSVQNVVFEPEGGISARLDDKPVLGLGGSPASEATAPADPPRFDRRGARYPAAAQTGDIHREARTEDIHRAHGAVPLLAGTSGWALYLAAPQADLDLRDQRRALLLPAAGPGEADDSPPAAGLVDLYLFDAAEPESYLRDLARVSGGAAMPPRWALGYFQSQGIPERAHDADEVVEAFRSRRFPLDAVVFFDAPDSAATEEAAGETAEPVELAGMISAVQRRNARAVLKLSPAAGGDSGDAEAALAAGADALWVSGDPAATGSRAVREAALAARQGKRPWSLHDAGEIGMAGDGAWLTSGATEAAWETLKAEIPAALHRSLSLSPWWGSEIGGRRAAEEGDAELYARWFQFAAFTPLFRAHGDRWRQRLPWAYADSQPAVWQIARRYAELRYRLLPYNYSLAWQAHTSGMPPMRALWLHYPEDARAVTVGTEYLWGRDLLVAPVYRKGAARRQLYLPPGTWYDWWSGERLEGGRRITREAGLDTLPLYARAGAIIPLDPPRQHVGERAYGPTTLKVFRGDHGDFVLYDDDGESLDYLDGDAALTRILWDDTESMLTIEPARPSRGTAGHHRFLIEMVPQGQTRRLTYLGRRVTIDFGN